MPRKIKVVKQKATEPDEFISTSSRVLDYIKNNYVAIGSAVAVILVVVIIIFGLGYYSREREKEALDLFAQAKQMYQQSTSAQTNQQPPTPLYSQALEKFKEVVENYSHATSATTSLLYMGDCYYHLKDYDKAIDHYMRFLNTSDKDNYLRQFAFEGLGYCYEEKGDHEKALDYFKQSLNEGNCAIQNLLYLNIARCYEALKDNTSALEYYKKAGGDESNSPFFTLAQDKVAAQKD